MVRVCGTTGEHSRRMLKSPSSKAAASEGPRRYPLGYVEGLNDARTLLADFFSILLDQRRKRNQRYNALMSTDPNMTGNPNLKNCQKEMG